jgi:hypothetical protein
MEGFNPDQSLIPSVGGSITAMSGGGGQEGGELGTDGKAAILELNETDFKGPLYTSVLKKLAPSLESVNFTQYWETEGSSNKKNESLKQEVLNSVLANHTNDMEITIESDSPIGITEAQIQEVLESLNVPIDIDKVKIRLAQDGLTITFLTGNSTYTPPSLNPPPPPGPPPTPPPRPPLTPSSPTKDGGFATLEEAAADAATQALNDLESE